MPFTHTCGDTPLAGYTIKRGISTGGFGEVYFGLSGGGKEVALKRITRHHDIELRGIRQCLNLKHPNLVHLYDLKTDEQNNYWLVMEYVRGETLHAIIRKHPTGLPHDLIRPWFAQLAAAVHSLHEQGIVHRDLKPANIFLEQGVVKVGDYGLCKFIGGSQHRSQTHNVGTVHYMAPEIGKGDYSRPIDIYAAGVLLYEMVTGRVPFDGETTGEILFKHLSASPDLTRAGPFGPIIAKAMAKVPGERFTSLADMAKRVNDTTPLESPRTTFVPMTSPTPTFVPPSPQPTAAVSTVVLAPPDSLGDLAGRLALAAVVCAAVAMVWGMMFLGGNWERMLPAFDVAVAGSWALLILCRRWTTMLDESLPRRLAQGLVGVAIGALAVWVEGYSTPGPNALVDATAPRSLAVPSDGIFNALYSDNRTLGVLAGHVAYFGLVFAVLRWWQITNPARGLRVSAPALLASGFWAYVLLFLLPSSEERLLGFGATVTMSLALQVACPRYEPAPTPSKKMRLRWA